MTYPTTSSNILVEDPSPESLIPVASFAEPNVKADATRPSQATSNPYAAPVQCSENLSPNDVVSNNAPSLQKLQLINGFLLGTLLTIILGFVIVGVVFFVPSLTPLILAVPLIVLANWTCIVVLAYLSRNLASAVFSGVLYALPLLNLIILVSVYDRSRKILKDHGYKSGWLKMELAPEAYNQLANERGLAPVILADAATTEKKERSSTGLVITYVLIGVLVGMIALSIVAS